MHAKGEGVNKSFHKAAELFEQAARQGYVPAQYSLAVMLFKGEISRHQSFQKTLYWFEEVARQGYALAPYELALIYSKSKEADQEPQEIFYWMKRSARRDYVLAQHELALMYKKGVGTKQNSKKAYQWFKKAAEQGHVPAQYELALMYEEGRRGLFFKLAKDLSQTYYWLMEASKQKYAPAQDKLADMVCKGEGAKEDINKAIAWFKEASEQGILGTQACLDKIREKNIAIGAVGLLAIAGAEQGYAQDHESPEEIAFSIEEGRYDRTEESASGLSVDSQTVSGVGEESDTQTDFEVSEGSVSQAVSEANAGSASQIGEMSSEISEEIVTEISEEIVTEVSDVIGEVAADLALDWIPGVGFGKLGFETIIGIHLLTGRSLTPFERVASGGGAVLNLFGFGWLKNLKSLKHSKVVGQQVNKWVSGKFNGEQLAELVRFMKKGQVERARSYLKSFVQSVGDIGFKVKRRVRYTVRSTRKIFVRGGSSVDEVSETVVINMEEGLGVPGKLESGKLSRAIDPDKMSNPGQSKVYRTSNVDPVPDTSHHKVFVRTPRGDQALNYNNPEVLGWLRQAEVPQRQSLEDLIKKGINKAARGYSSVPQSLIKNGAKASEEMLDFDLVLH